MLISKIFNCRHCGGLAHEYHGLEGAIYLAGRVTPFSCPKGTKPDKDIPDVMRHDFKCVKKVNKNEPPNKP